MAGTTTPTSAPTNYLDPQALASVGSLELRARMIVEGMMTGMHRSPFQGASIEFAQHRPYTAGDDLRHLDWKVYGRTDKLYLKQYQKETNLDLVLLLDVSGSMAYGSHLKGERGQAWRKYDHAATIAVAMAYLALRQQDRVGLIKFSGRSQAATRMSNAGDHRRAVIEALSSETFEHSPNADGGVTGPGGEDKPTDMGRLFDEVLAKLTRRSLIVLISDLFDDSDVLEQGLARLAHRRHDLIVLQTLDPAELDFPFRSPTDFIGLENEGRLGIDPQALRKDYLKALRRHLERIEAITRRFKFDYLRLNTAESVGPPLSHFLARRTAMLGKG